MTYKPNETVKCRGCRKDLTETWNRYCYNPITKEEAKWNHYGGWVCSERCDYRSALELEQTMPGHTGQTSLGYHLSKEIERRWAKQL